MTEEQKPETYDPYTEYEGGKEVAERRAALAIVRLGRPDLYQMIVGGQPSPDVRTHPQINISLWRERTPSGPVDPEFQTVFFERIEREIFPLKREIKEKDRCLEKGEEALRSARAYLRWAAGGIFFFVLLLLAMLAGK